MFLNTDSKIYVAFGSTGGTASSSTVTTNTWYRLDYRIVISGTTGTIDWQIDGTAQTQHVDTGLASGGTMGATRIGFVTSTTGNGYWDDFVQSVTSGDYPIGAGGTEIETPTALSSLANASSYLKDNGGTAIATITNDLSPDLDDIPPSASAYVYQSDASGTHYARMYMSDISATHSGIIGAMG